MTKTNASHVHLSTLVKNTLDGLKREKHFDNDQVSTIIDYVGEDMHYALAYIRTMITATCRVRITDNLKQESFYMLQAHMVKWFDELNQNSRVFKDLKDIFTKPKISQLVRVNNKSIQGKNNWKKRLTAYVIQCTAYYAALTLMYGLPKNKCKTTLHNWYEHNVENTSGVLQSELLKRKLLYDQAIVYPKYGKCRGSTRLKKERSEWKNINDRVIKKAEKRIQKKKDNLKKKTKKKSKK